MRKTKEPDLTTETAAKQILQLRSTQVFEIVQSFGSSALEALQQSAISTATKRSFQCNIADTRKRNVIFAFWMRLKRSGNETIVTMKSSGLKLHSEHCLLKLTQALRKLNVQKQYRLNLKISHLR